MITNFSIPIDFDRKKDVLAFGRAEKIRPFIEEAIPSGECLKVRYWGGGQPGEVREIVPLNLIGSGQKVLALCVSEQINKHYFLSKMEIVSIDEIDTYEADRESTPFDIVLKRHVHLLFQFSIFKCEIEDGCLKVFEPHINNRLRFKTYPFLIIDFNSQSNSLKYRFNIHGWRRSFSSIEEAIAYACYYLDKAEKCFLIKSNKLSVTKQG